MARVVSLIPSATEIVCALDCEDQLVGRSHECDFPMSVRSLPVCTRPKFNPEGTSREIDQRVKALLAEAVSVYQIAQDQLKKLSPQVILTQAQCEVCGVSLHDVEQAIGGLMGNVPRLVSLSPIRLEDVWADINQVAVALGVEDNGRTLVQNLRTRMEIIAKTATAETIHPTVGCIEWLDPLMASANWMPELVTLAGGRNVFGLAGEHAPWINWEMLQEHDPDILLLLPCGFSIARTRDEMSSLTGKPGWADLKAVKSNQVYFTDGNQYFNRSGPRLVDSLEILAEILYPSRFQFGHEGQGWVRWENED